ncbi:hypothetical protein PDIG_70440 [Penicillium digitatum PHI26]|uniref:Uncharacterized protein n=2 Tax=Penicillium digitatum TaxID=36651 RepID=K9FZ74_PEND2|nr:hypothetical protein PDIP_79750 [Penicillium digitatum Pd1]EKV06350.1 hypothetical protein PDIP_79750 [Penicillium digitatum Pd1]EKV07968.1 hypothetical protein PDIG_70440 [Penicillium digitatum PHI26]
MPLQVPVLLLFCGTQWKTCDCLYAEEENLYERDT